MISATSKNGFSELFIAATKQIYLLVINIFVFNKFFLRLNCPSVQYIFTLKTKQNKQKTCNVAIISFLYTFMTGPLK